jgi:hypothetical protein
MNSRDATVPPAPSAGLPSFSSLELHLVGDKVNEVVRKVVASLEQQVVRAVNPAMGFPTEMEP